MSGPRVGVIGAGIMGVSSAVCIQEAIPGVDITIMSDKSSPNTTSNIAAGILGAPVQPNDAERSLRWGNVTFEYGKKLAQSELASTVGAMFISGYRITNEESPIWKEIAMGMRKLNPDEMEMFPGAKFGFYLTTALLDSNKYIPWLMNRFQERGGRIIQAAVKNLADVAENYDILVNCTGLGANALVGDKSVRPLRGQVMKVYAPWLKHFYYDDRSHDNPTYIFPGAESVTVGGTRDENNWSDAVDSTVKQQIWQRCTDLVPSLKTARVLFDKVGLRPHRPIVRLEAESMNIKGKHINVVHNYGHGSYGISLHWGCAQDTAKLVVDCWKGQTGTEKSKL